MAAFVPTSATVAGVRLQQDCEHNNCNYILGPAGVARVSKRHFSCCKHIICQQTSTLLLGLGPSGPHNGPGIESEMGRCLGWAI